MKQLILYIMIILTGTFFLSHADAAPTHVKGNIVKAVWNPSGSPYIIEDHCTVPLGEKLVIEPGTTVIMGSNVSMTVIGHVIAIGEKNNRIVFTSGAGNVYWNKIIIKRNPSNIMWAEKSRFQYCDFNNAQTALSLEIYGVNSALETDITNCRFTNCSQYGIMGKAAGERGFVNGKCIDGSPSLNPDISNCTFFSCANGIGIKVIGKIGECLGGIEERTGFAFPTMTNNIFNNISGIAVNMINDPYSRNSKPLLVNNLIVNCKLGVRITDPYGETEITNNIFSGNEIAVTTTTNDYLSVTYNCFYNNLSAFQGWIDDPAVTGNIYTNPFFMNPDAGNFHLSANSPCIDAGEPGDNEDECFPPALGTLVGDMGVYGGAKTCQSNSLPNVPALVSPENGDVDIGINMMLEWSCDDPDGDPLVYDVYLGKTNPPPYYLTLNGDTTFNPRILDGDARYYWMVTARDSAGEENQGPVWQFRTRPDEGVNSVPFEVERFSRSNGSSSSSCFINVLPAFLAR